jgi:lipopolysaccharide export system protein LptA
MPLLISLVALLCLLSPARATARTGDREQPIHVQADTVEIDDKRGISVYRGKVSLSQGSMVLHADTLTVHHPQRKLEKATAEGHPAEFQEDLDQPGKQVKAQARTMDYAAVRGVLVLSGQAQLFQDGNQFSGSRIEYDLKSDVVHASRDEAGHERVQVTIQPPPEKPGAKPAKKPVKKPAKKPAQKPAP